MSNQTNKTSKQKVSEYLAIAAIIIVLTYIVDAAVGQGKIGFLPMSEAQRGMILGLSSIILFFAAFGIGFKEKSKLTMVLLIAGGALIGTSVLGASAIAEGGLAAIKSSFLAVIIIGYIIMSLGILMAFKINRHT